MSEFLLAWLDLESRLLKAARPVEVAFTALNLTTGIVPYRQAALWRAEGGIVALSGTATVEAHAPYALWLHSLLTAMTVDKPRQVTAHDVPATLAGQWVDWLPVHVALLPARGEVLMFARDEVFDDGEMMLLERTAELTGAMRVALAPRRSGWGVSIPKGRKLRYGAAAAVLALLFPVTSSVLAPAESVPANPVVVRAPLDGVIDAIAVSPNQPVAVGDALFALDATTLSGRLDVARQAHATAEAEYRQAAQAMVFDAKAKTQVAILAGKADEKNAEMRLLESQLERIQVKASRDGIAVFDDATELIGRPVAVGERVMMLANETDTEVEAWVAAADIGEVRDGGALTLFLNTAPLSPVRATVRAVAYEASARPDATIAYRVRARLNDGEEKPRLGLKGTARIDGDTVPLVWWLFRRPLATIRQFLGF